MLYNNQNSSLFNHLLKDQLFRQLGYELINYSCANSNFSEHTTSISAQIISEPLTMKYIAKSKDFISAIDSIWKMDG